MVEIALTSYSCRVDQSIRESSVADQETSLAMRVHHFHEQNHSSSTNSQLLHCRWLRVHRDRLYLKPFNMLKRISEDMHLAEEHQSSYPNLEPLIQTLQRFHSPILFCVVPQPHKHYSDMPLQNQHQCPVVIITLDNSKLRFSFSFILHSNSLIMSLPIQYWS